jgi:hypothetical protein
MAGQEIFKTNSDHFSVSTFHILCLHTEIWIKTNIYSFCPYGLRNCPGFMFAPSNRLIFCPVCYRIMLFFATTFLVHSIFCVPTTIFPSNISQLTSNPLSSSRVYICGITDFCSNSLSHDSHNTQRIFPYPELRDWTVCWRWPVCAVRYKINFWSASFLKKKGGYCDWHVFCVSVSVVASFIILNVTNFQGKYFSHIVSVEYTTTMYSCNSLETAILKWRTRGLERQER